MGGSGDVHQKREDWPHQLHAALIHSQILPWLQQKIVGLAIASSDAQLARTLLRGQHIESRYELHDADDASGMPQVGARNRKAHVPRPCELWGHLSKVDV